MSETDSNQANQSQSTSQQPTANFLSSFNDTIPSTPRSAVAAGILGIFLGAFGAHNWYLGQKRRGLLHCIILGAGLIICILFGVLAGVTAFSVPALSIFFTAIATIGTIAIWGNSIWGLVEGIIILTQGDPALAARGYTVAAPVVYQQPTPTTAPTTSAPAEKSETKSEKSTKSADKKSDK